MGEILIDRLAPYVKIRFIEPGEDLLIFTGPTEGDCYKQLIDGYDYQNNGQLCIDKVPEKSD